jgi:predicted ArsR family transcriptional regulator
MAPASSFNFDSTDKQIVAYLNKEDWPVTTEMVAKEVGISWNTAQLHLFKLQADGFLRGKRVGRQNQWMLTDKGKQQ